MTDVEFDPSTVAVSPSGLIQPRSAVVPTPNVPETLMGYPIVEAVPGTFPANDRAETVRILRAMYPGATIE